MGRAGIRAVTASILLAAIAALLPVQAAALETGTEQGHFYTEASGQAGSDDQGYSISDSDGISFWTEFQRLGGVDALGYPVTHRFEWRGTVVQALQRAVLQWQPAEGRSTLINIFDELAAAGKDGWLREVRGTPEQVWLPDEDKLSWPEIVRRRQAFLDPYPALKARYFATPDPLHLYGLPTSRVEDMGPAYVVRLQRGVIQQWKIDTESARAGEVTVANGGDIAKEAGLFPMDAVVPAPAAAPSFAQQNSTSAGVPPARGRMVVALDPGHGGAEIGSAHRFDDGQLLTEKNVNLQVALKAAEFLRSAGYEVVLTRTKDSVVNTDRRDLNNSGSVSLADDLQARVDIANAAGAAVFVSLHHNGIANSGVRGTEIYYNAGRPFAGASQRLARYLQAGLLEELRNAGYQSIDRGVKTDTSIGRNFFLLRSRSSYVARASEMPSALGEALFLTNPADAAQLRTPRTIDALALGYARGIGLFLNEG